MSRHLSWEQMSRCLIGDATAEEARHARECLACRAKLRRVETSLSELRRSVWSWSQGVAQRNSKEEEVVLMNQSQQLHPTTMDGLAGLYGGNESKTFGASMLIHVAAVAVLLVAGTLTPVQRVLSRVTPLIAPVELKPVEQSKGGGGGGAKQPLVKKDLLPKPAPRQFTPPNADVQQANIMVAPTINADIPDINSVNVGAPTGVNIAMNGAGAGGGIGKGYSGGVGNGTGIGVGSGSGGSMGGGIRIGPGVTPPVPIFSPEPEYSEEARKAKFQGVVRLFLVVDEKGNPTQIRVLTPLGLGLDEKAIEAVRKWKFKAGMKDGKPVAVQASVEVNFRLL